MAEKTSKKFVLIKRWKKHQMNILQELYPQLDEKELSDYLEEVIDKNLVNPKAEIHNNYIHESVNDTLLGVMNWVDRTNPIIAGFGVFFKDQNVAFNPSAVVLQKFGDGRKAYKDQLKDHHEDSDEYKDLDRKQGTEKVNTNSWYGMMGALASIIYNLYTAASVTSTGQSLISTAAESYEAFMANNVKFIDLDDCMNFLENIRKEKHSIPTTNIPVVSVDKLYDRLVKQFYEFDEDYGPIIYNYLSSQSSDFMTRAYYKNNLYEYSYLPYIRHKLTTIFRNTKEFKNPNKIPKETEWELNDLWEHYQEFVMYNYPAFDRVKRLKTDKRKSVIIVDTDSNFLSLEPWVAFSFAFIIAVDNDLVKRDQDTLAFIAINTMCYMLTKFIQGVLWKYTKTANIPKSYRAKINMKNEYLLRRIALVSKKKRYAASALLREGKEFSPMKTEIKGLDFIKITAKEETKKFFTNVIEQRILKSHDINVADILRDLESFEHEIMRSLRAGERKFLRPISVKQLGSYDDPYKMQGVRAAIVWNFIYPDNTIILPDKFDIIKVKLGSEKLIEGVKHVDEKVYNILMKSIVNNREPKIAKKCVEAIAFPRNVKNVPEWLLPFIDYSTIVTDNLKLFKPILETLGIQTIKSTHKEYVSNILKL